MKYICAPFFIHSTRLRLPSNCSKPLQAVSNRAIYLPGQRKWSLALIFNHSPAAVCKVIREVVTNSPTELPSLRWDSLTKIRERHEPNRMFQLQPEIRTGKNEASSYCVALCVMETQREVWTETHRTERGSRGPEDTEDWDPQGLQWSPLSQKKRFDRFLC